VIPYVEKNGILYFLLAKDRISGDLTDFGGGVKNYESALVGGLREFMEESNSIFGKEFYTSYNEFEATISLVDYDRKMAIIFIPVKNSWLMNAGAEFERKMKTSRDKKGSQEVREVIWLSSFNFRSMIVGEHSSIWVRVKRFLLSNFTVQVEAALKVVYSRSFPFRF